MTIDKNWHNVDLGVRPANPVARDFVSKFRKTQKGKEVK